MCFFFWLFCVGGVVLFSGLFSLCLVYWFFVFLFFSRVRVSVFLGSWLCVLYASVSCLRGLPYVCVVVSVLSLCLLCMVFVSLVGACVLCPCCSFVVVSCGVVSVFSGVLPVVYCVLSLL